MASITAAIYLALKSSLVQRRDRVEQTELKIAAPVPDDEEIFARGGPGLGERRSAL